MERTNTSLNRLPFNRKERYFTGTVFPMIVCKDNFRHFHLFASLLEGFEYDPERFSRDLSSIQFFTEYSLKEAIFGASAKDFPRPPKTKDTPDIMMYIKAQIPILITIEAKMFTRTTGASLNTQMKKQRQIIDYLKSRLGIVADYHYALLPKKVKDALTDLQHRSITWEDILEKYENTCSGDFFYGVLKYASDNFDELVAKPSRRGSNSDGMMYGKEILEQLDAKTLKMKWVGRAQGLKGSKFKEDLKNHRWQTQMYEVCRGKKPNNPNWFSIKKFESSVRPKNKNK